MVRPSRHHFLPAPFAASSRSGLRAGPPEHRWASWARTAACPICRELTPLEEASLQNQKLKAAYEARMARLDPSQALQKTSLVSRARGGSVLLGAGGQASFLPPSPPDPVPAAADDGESGDRQGPGGDCILLSTQPPCPGGTPGR